MTFCALSSAKGMDIKMKIIIEVFKNYPDSISALCATFTLFGCIVSGFFNHIVNKKKLTSTQKSLEEKIEKLQIKCNEYKERCETLEKLISDDIVKDNNGDFYYWKSKHQRLCPVCWITHHKIVPINDRENTGYYKCIICNHKGIYNKNIVNQVQNEYSYAAEPPVKYRLSHLSRRSEPL